MAGALGNLLITLTADTAQARSDIGKAAHEVERDMASMARNATAAGAVIGIAVAEIGAAFVRAAKDAVMFGDQLNKMSQRTGIAVERLSELAFAGELADVSLGSIGQGMSQFNKALAEAAKEGGRAAEVFASLGVDIASGPQAAFEQFAKAINSLPDGEVKSAAMRAAFGRVGDALIPMIAGLDDATQKAQQLGLVVSEQMARDSERFNDAMTTIGAASRGLVQTALLPLASVFADMATNIMNATAQGNIFKGMLYELGRVSAAFFGGLANLFGDEKAVDDAFSKFQALTINPEAPAASGSPAPSVDQGRLQAALARINAGKSGRGRAGKSDNLAGDQWQAWMEEEAKIMAEAAAATSKYMQTVREREAAEVQAEIAAQVARAESIQQMQDILDMQTLMSNGFDENGRKIKDETKKASDIGRELGLTFSSAFEDAIIQGKKFSEVLRSIAQDVARVMLRKTVTEPLAKSAGSFIDGIDFGAIFGGGKAAGGPVMGGTSYLVGEQGPELFTPGVSGTITPNHAMGGGVTVVQHNYVDSRSDRSSILQAMAAAKDQAKAEIMASLNRGGEFAMATGRA